jgi:hypothetical protein
MSQVRNVEAEARTLGFFAKDSGSPAYAGGPIAVFEH